MVALAELRERVRRIERPLAAAHGVVPFGVAAIDRVLPGGGLARGVMHEIVGAGGDEEDGALAAAFAAGILGRLAAAGNGIVLWCLRRPDLYGPGLAACGLDPGRLVLARTGRDADILWAVEEGLRAAGVAAVVGEIGTLPAVASRRLPLAAERSGVTLFLLRRWRDAGEAARERNQPNAAATRWRITALPSTQTPACSAAAGALPLPLGGEGRGEGVTLPLGGRGFFKGHWVGRPRWRVELVRCRGGAPACWEVEAADATGHVSLAAELADRSAPSSRDFEKIRRIG